MICPKCGGDTFIIVSDVGLKCENCGYIYSIEKKMNNNPLFFNFFFMPTCFDCVFFHGRNF